MCRDLLSAVIVLAIVLPTLAQSKKGIVETYEQLVKEKGEGEAGDYLNGLSNSELVTACREAHDLFAARYPRGKAVGDVPRDAAMGMGIAGFLETYAKKSAKAKEDIDPTPFHKMILDRSLDSDFRRTLVGMMGSANFYHPSWAFIGQDLAAYRDILKDGSLDPETRLRAAVNIQTFITCLYMEQYHKTPALSKIPLDSDTRKRIYPNVVKMLADNHTPKQFSVEERQRLTFLTDAATKETRDVLVLVKDIGTSRARLVTRNILASYLELHLTKIDAFIDKP